MQLADFNVARMRGPIGSPVMQGFVDGLERINALADASPGFVWRLADDSGDATSYRPFPDEDVIINLAVWDSVEALRAYVYKSDHVTFLRRRREWFAPWGEGPFLVLWWVPDGHVPTVEEAMARLARLAEEGPSPHAFTFRELFDPPLEPVP
jgi:hypothetical protein